MKKYILALSLISTIVFSTPVFAAGSGEHASGSVRHSGMAMSHAGASGVKLVAGVVAVPFKALGAIGELSGQAGDSMFDFATGDDEQGLAIGEESVSVGPSPKHAMQSTDNMDI